MMKVAQLTKYNKQNPILNIVDIPIPQINDNQALVKIKTAGVNPLDNMISRGEVKLVTPYKLPLTAGNEMVGIIEKVGVFLNLEWGIESSQGFLYLILVLSQSM